MKNLAFSVAAAIFLLLLAGCGSPKKSTPPPAQPTVNVDAEVNADVSTNEAVVRDPTTLSGKVFVKGYGTPSESYGLLAVDGREIGFGSYDSMEEEFRPYVGDQVSVIFSSICRAGVGTCCRTVFPLCGTVTNWKSLSGQ